uniref:hypothetical protein n=1 Tax=Microbulbifer agarilyticus TaxID=260552 RepID=UPI000255BABA|nr:hypothetical protein [Microbulbifer agarilyticus]
MTVTGKGLRRTRARGLGDGPMRMRVLFRSWLFLAALSLWCGVAHGSDKPGNFTDLSAEIHQQVASVELVAQVEIVAVHRLLDRALSEPGMAAVSGYLYSAIARKVWKGATHKQLSFQLNLGDCEEKLALGARYLIFAKRNTFGEMALSGCDAAIVESDATGVLAQLHQYYQG